MMRILALLGLALCTSCVAYSYHRHATYEPVSEAAIKALEIGKSDIGDALSRLGAPLYVWEGVADAVVLAYGNENRREHGFKVSVPLFEQTSASFNYDDIASRLEGYVLVFDADLKLKIVRAGLLRELGKVTKRRPDTVE